jgi:hypothetical protein
MRGLGSTYLATTSLAGGPGAQRLLPNPFFSFNYSAEATTIEAQGFVAGQQQTVAAAAGSVTHNLTLETQLIKRSTRPLLTQTLAKDVTSVVTPVLKTAVVPSASPYEIPDALITSGNLGTILVFDEVVGPLTKTADATTAPANEYQVQVDTTGNDLIFNAAAAGRTITYTVPYTFSGKAYGGPGAATPLGELVFRGYTYDFGTERTLIEFPKLSLINVVELPLTGDVPTFSLEMLAAVPDGWDKPYRMLEEATAA